MKKRITQFFKCGYSLATMEHMVRDGTISQNEFEAYCAVWEWCAYRLSGNAAMKQESFWNRFGKEAFYRRMNKVRSAFNLSPV